MTMAIRDPQYGGYRIFVGDLGPKVLKQDLEKAFEQFGRLLDCWVARNPPGHAFLLFKHSHEAERAVERMEGSIVSGRHIRVEHARPHNARMKEISRRGGTLSHSHTITRDLSRCPKESSYSGPRPRDRIGKDWNRSYSRQRPSHTPRSPPSRHHSDCYDHYRRRRSRSYEHDRYTRRRSEEARDRSPRNWASRDRSPRRSPRDWPSRDRSPRDRPPRDRSPRDRSGRDRSSRDRSPRSRSPSYRSPRDRSPSDGNYYEDRTGSRSSQKLMSVAAPFPKKVVMKIDQGNQTDVEIIAAMGSEVQNSCSRPVGDEQTTLESENKPSTQRSSPVNGRVTIKCGSEDDGINKADDNSDKLMAASGKTGDHRISKGSTDGKDGASDKTSHQSKSEKSNSSCGPEESHDHGKTDREKSMDYSGLNRPRISLRLPATFKRSFSTHNHTSSSSASSPKHRSSSSEQGQLFTSSNTISRNRESCSAQVQTSPTSTSGRRDWSDSDSESDMSEDESGVTVTGGDVNGNEEVDVDSEIVRRESEREKGEIDNRARRDSEGTMTKASDKREKNVSVEIIKDDCDKTEKNVSVEMIKDDCNKTEENVSGEMIKDDSKKMEINDGEEVIKDGSKKGEKNDIRQVIHDDSTKMEISDGEKMIKDESEKAEKNNNEEMECDRRVNKDSDKTMSNDNAEVVGKDSEYTVKWHRDGFV